MKNTPQQHLNRITALNPSKRNAVSVKPHPTKESGLNKLKLSHNRKAVIEFGIMAIAIAVIVVGFLAFNPFKAKAEGLTTDEVKALIEKEKIVQQGNVDTQPNEKTENTDTNPSQVTLPPSPLEEPVAARESCREPTGQFTRLYFRQRNLVNAGAFGFNKQVSQADVLGAFKYTGNCPIDIYVEAGINAQPQSVNPLAIQPSGFTKAIKGSPSACDGNVHYNGVVFKQVQPNGVIVFELQPENYGNEGTYWLDIGAWTGCAKDGGKSMANKRGLVGFSNKYQVNTNDLNRDIHMSWVQLAP